MSKNWTRDGDEFHSPLDEVIKRQNELMRSGGNQDSRPNNQRFDDRNRQQQRYPNGDNRNNHDNRGNNNYDNRNDNRNNNNNQQNANQTRNPFLKLIGNDGRVYSNKKNEIYNLLINDKGFDTIIQSLKDEKKNPGNAKYIQALLRDPVSASQFIEATHEIIGEDNEGGKYSKKQLQLIMTEIYTFINSSFNKEIVNRYDPDTLETMRDAYRDILYQFNKKKVKLLTKEIGDLDKKIAKEIVILSSGNNAISVYHLIKFLYKNSDTEDSFDPEPKSLKKLFAIAYGSYKKDDRDKLKIDYENDKFKNVIKWIMLERALPADNNLSDSAKDVYANITKMVCKYLDKCERNVIDDIIIDFVSERRKLEDGRPCMPRRFNPKGIHPDDFPNIIDSVTRIERKDFSTIPFLGRVNKDFNEDKDEVNN